MTDVWNASVSQTFVCNTRRAMRPSGQPRRACSKPARLLAAAALAALAGCAAAPPASVAVTIVQHPLPGTASGAGAIAAAAGGLYVTRAQQSSTVLERITPVPFAAGPLQSLGALDLGAGTDGQLLLLAVTGATGSVALERQPAGGALEPRFEFPVALGSGFWPEQFTTAPDGTLWIANMTGDAVEALPPAGAEASYPLPRAGAPTSVAVAPDGSVWFTELTTGTIGELSPGGVIVEHPLAGATPGGFGNAEPYSIVLGPDGALWFTEQALGRIGRISPDGVLEEFAIPGPPGIARGEYGSPAPRYITVGPDGALWFTDGGDESIGRITTAGQISEYPIGTRTPSSPEGIVTVGGELWFAQEGLTALGSVDPNGQPAPVKAATSTRPRLATRRRLCASHRREAARNERPKGSSSLGCAAKRRPRPTGA